MNEQEIITDKQNPEDKTILLSTIGIILFCLVLVFGLAYLKVGGEILSIFIMVLGAFVSNYGTIVNYRYGDSKKNNIATTVSSIGSNLLK